MVREKDGSYTYKSGVGSVLLESPEAQNLRMDTLENADDLLVWKIDGDMLLSVRGTAGTIRIPGWYSGHRRLAAVQLSDGSRLDPGRLEALAVEKEPDIDITPVSFDRIIRAAAGQVEVIGSGSNDYLFGNSLDNTLRGMGGNNIYYYRLGEECDTIINTGEPGCYSVLRFHTDIAPGDVTVARSENDMCFRLPDGGSVTVRGWYRNSAARLTRAEFYDGTCWDARDLEKLASGRPLSPRGYVLHSSAAEKRGQQEADGKNPSGGCTAGAASGLFVLLSAILLRAGKSGFKRIALWMLALIALFCVESAWAFPTQKFIGPSVSLGTGQLRGGKTRDVILKPGYAYLGTKTNDELRSMFTVMWGVNSHIKDHTITLEKLYVPDDEKYRLVQGARLSVALPQKIDLVVGKSPLAQIIFGTSDDLPLGKHATKVMCDVSLPAELGGGVKSTYVLYELDVINPEIRTDVLGGMIGSIEENRYFDKFGREINEGNISGKISPWNLRKGFTADGNARLLVRLQASSPAMISLSISDNDKMKIKTETLARQACDIRSIQLEKITENLYQKTLVLVAPDE